MYYISLEIYYDSKSFSKIKNSIKKYTINSNELNKHIEIFGIRYKTSKLWIRKI